MYVAVSAVSLFMANDVLDWLPEYPLPVHAEKSAVRLWQADDCIVMGAYISTIDPEGKMYTIPGLGVMAQLCPMDPPHCIVSA